MDKIKKKKGFVCLLLLLSIIFTNAFPDRIVRAESVDHTHVWASTYDENHHWEYCTVCGEIRNEEEHNFTDHWALGHEGCEGGNYDIKTCSCGYSYTYFKPHSFGDTFLSTNRFVHVQVCSKCGSWGVTENCYDEEGPIGCTNPGTCKVCGTVATENSHILSHGICKFCGKKFVDFSNLHVEYSSDYSKCVITFTLTPLDPSVTITGAYNIGWAPYINYSSADVSSVLNADGSRNFTTTIVFKEHCSDITGIGYGNSDGLVKINGQYVYEEGYFTVDTYRDHTAPVISTVDQTNQTEKDGWATIKKLDISGTEENSSYVHLSIEDPLTGEVLVEDATVSVVDGKWSYSCTPPIEANEDGHDFTVKVYDDNNNTSTKDFTVYKADCIAPTLDCPTSYTDWTDTAKDITFTIKDGGVGSPQVSLGNQTSYKPCTNVNGKWQITYTFSDNITGTKDYNLYLKDALGNARKVTITVGNIDKNKYTITYNLNGGNISDQKATYTRTTETFTLPTPTKTGYTFTGWTGSNGTTAQKSVNIKKGSYGDLLYTANWSYDPIKVSMPQTLIGDKNGNSQFMVKSDDIKAGSIEVTFPKGFYYNQAGKNPVFASLLSDGSTTITKDNKAVKCKIITDGLTAGCWSGTFNIGLKLTK